MVHGDVDPDSPRNMCWREESPVKQWDGKRHIAEEQSDGLAGMGWARCRLAGKKIEDWPGKIQQKKCNKKETKGRRAGAQANQA